MSSFFYYEPFYDFDRLIDDAFNLRQSNPGTQLQRRGQDNHGSPIGTLKPRLDLHEDNQSNAVTATFELPGLKKEDVSIDVHNGRLTVSGESRVSSDRDEGGYSIRERRFGKFSRSLQLPQGVKEEQIKANMDNGILSVTFPKASPEAAPKKITIS
ncbi:hypothetical protein H0H87_001494 [Tephrocybe sp. NHM501043]|nr:hypothetical protein H0H87_001494 [Tephrocybe sp. NHM501043]